MWARIENGSVAELTDIDPEGRFHPSLEWVACDDTTTLGMTYDGAFHEPVVLAPTAEEVRAMIAARRFQAETAGIVIDGSAIDTGRDSQALITGAAVSAMLDTNYSCQWKTPSGFIELTSQQIIAIASEVRAHVQACFDREAELLAAVSAGTFTESQLDEGWPA